MIFQSFVMLIYSVHNTLTEPNVNVFGTKFSLCIRIRYTYGWDTFIVKLKCHCCNVWYVQSTQSVRTAVFIRTYSYIHFVIFAQLPTQYSVSVCICILLCQIQNQKIQYTVCSSSGDQSALTISFAATHSLWLLINYVSTTDMAQ